MKNGRPEMFEVNIDSPGLSIDGLNYECERISEIVNDRLIQQQSNKKHRDQRQLLNPVKVYIDEIFTMSTGYERITLGVNSSCKIAMDVQKMLREKGYVVGELK
ncbi:hypothetical protein ACJW8B_15880 [Plesiomonas shigelloides]|uniref:hypothetical protein n=1 Tax=Plesiomonas shigelloides TaxID=703 RepID=UPI00387F1DB2